MLLKWRRKLLSDLPLSKAELYFLIARFLSQSLCQSASEVIIILIVSIVLGFRIYDPSFCIDHVIPDAAMGAGGSWGEYPELTFCLCFRTQPSVAYFISSTKAIS